MSVSLGKAVKGQEEIRRGNFDNRNKSAGLGYLGLNVHPQHLIEKLYQPEMDAHRGRCTGLEEEGDISGWSLSTGLDRAAKWVSIDKQMFIHQPVRVHHGIHFSVDEAAPEMGSARVINVLQSEKLVAIPDDKSSKEKFNLEAQHAHEGLEHHDPNESRTGLPTHDRDPITLEPRSRDFIPFAGAPPNSDISNSVASYGTGATQQNNYNDDVGQRRLL